MAVEQRAPDLIAINETWLRQDDVGYAADIPGYRLRHIARSRSVRQARSGGVGFYVKVGIKARLHPHPESTAGVEQMWLSMNINNVKIIVGTAYRPQWMGVNTFFDALTDSVTSFSQFDKIVLLGDFNINLLDTGNILTSKLNEFLTCIKLVNVVDKPTHFTDNSASLIDVVCTDVCVLSVSVDHIPDLGRHAMITVEFKIKKTSLLSVLLCIGQLKILT